LTPSTYTRELDVPLGVVNSLTQTSSRNPDCLSSLNVIKRYFSRCSSEHPLDIFNPFRQTPDRWHWEDVGKLWSTISMVLNRGVFCPTHRHRRCKYLSISMKR